MSKKVAVALSGGVDSAVTALLLQEQGYDVVGITGKMTCSNESEEVVKNAKKVAEKLGIDFFEVDVTKQFNEKVVKYFENSYINGKTPNPCIMCNKYIKWGELFDYAINVLKADYVATGHYANIKEENGIYKLYPASDEHKDQLYFLFALSQEHLKRTLFPLSKYKKDEVRRLAIGYDLPPKSAKESQDICFIKSPMTTKKYLNNIFGAKEGNFVEKKTGKVLGKHDGFWQYTIGQRKGIGLAAPEALYVIGIDALTNTVYVGYKDELYFDELELKELDFCYPNEQDEFEGLVKIRYNMNSVPAKITKLENSWKIKFDEPVTSLTEGQACVIYDKLDGHLIAGGWI